MGKKSVKLFCMAFIIFMIFGAVALHATAAKPYEPYTFEEILIPDDEVRIIEWEAPSYDADAEISTLGYKLPEYYGRSILSELPNSAALIYAYDQMVSGLNSSAKEISVYDGTNAISREQFLMVFDIVLRDHTEFFWLGKNNSYSYKKSLKTVVSLTPGYIFSGEALKTAKAEFNAAAEEILSGITEDMNALDRELYIHDSLAERITYVLDAAHAHDPYGALVEGEAVCEGYAEALQYLLQKVGIQSFLVLGESGGVGHAWNLVKIDGKYYYVDLTWNDGDKYTFHAYFNITTAQLLEDHTIAKTNYRIPTCTSLDANLFAMLDLRMETFDLDRIIEIIKEYEGVADIFVTGNRNAFIKAFTDNLKAIADALGYKKIKAGYLRLGREVVLVVIEDTHEHSFTVENASGKYLKSEATCQQKAVYYYSCECGECGTETFEYGELSEHKYGAEYSSNEETHWRECTVCGKKDEAAHAYTSENASEKYLKSEATCKQKAVYYYSCECGKCGTETFEYGELGEHKYGADYLSNEEKHWHECTVCGGKKDEAEHVYSYDCDATCNKCSYEREASHKFRDGWAHSYDKHYRYCTICRDTYEPADHEYTDDCDKDCNICGYERTNAPHKPGEEWVNDELYHWHICTACGEIAGRRSHFYKGICDADCIDCGYKRTVHRYGEWEKNAEKHWHVCVYCHLNIDEAEHVYDNACDTDCNVCGEKRTTEHKYKTEWSKNSKTHYHECEYCGDKTDITEHTFGEDDKCTVCGRGSRILGDLNDDGKVNAMDLIILRKYIAGLITDLDASFADINGDGKVGATDLIILRKLIAGFDVGLE